MSDALSIPDLYEALSWPETGKTGQTFNSFGLRNGGITTWQDLWKLNYPTVKFLQSLKGSIGGKPVDNLALWPWASKYNITGVAPYNIVRQNLLSPYHCHWPIIAASSGRPDLYPRNYYAVDAYSADGQWRRLAGITKMYEYSVLTLHFRFKN